MPIAAASSSRPSSLSHLGSTIFGRLLIGFAATVVVAAAAHIALPLPFTPVPLTLQPLAVLGVGLALGPAAGSLTMLAYLAEGAVGLPVFAPTGLGGIAQLFGPTGGFLLAYPFVAAVAGSLTRLLVRRVWPFAAALIGCTAAIAMLFVSGATWLMHLAHLSVYSAWIAAVAPFVPGEVIKVVIAAGVYRAFAPTARKRGPSGPASSL